MSMEQVYIRGRALVCSLGDDLGTVINRVKNRDCEPVNIPVQVASMDYSRPYYRIPGIERNAFSDLEKYFYNILFKTVSRALEDSGLSQNEIEKSALFFGSTSIDIPMFEWTYRQHAHNIQDKLSDEPPGYGKIASLVADHFGIKGPIYTFTTACTSSANCLLYASSMIRTGYIERAVVIGYDLYNDLGFYGFESLKLIEPSAYKPFDKNRIGIILGEGCGVVVLDKSPKTTNDFAFLGGCNACDTFNVTTHNNNGSEIAFTINKAMKNCGLTARDIHAVKAHATGSPINDQTEFNGMKLAFSGAIPPFSGIKPYIGHTVGACGTIELIIITGSIEDGFFPATPGFSEVDEEIKAYPLTSHREADSGNFMLNFFGFGGNCTSFIITNRM